MYTSLRPQAGLPNKLVVWKMVHSHGTLVPGEERERERGEDQRHARHSRWWEKKSWIWFLHEKLCWLWRRRNRRVTHAQLEIAKSNYKNLNRGDHESINDLWNFRGICLKKLKSRARLTWVTRPLQGIEGLTFSSTRCLLSQKGFLHRKLEKNRLWILENFFYFYFTYTRYTTPPPWPSRAWRSCGRASRTPRGCSWARRSRRRKPTHSWGSARCWCWSTGAGNSRLAAGAQGRIRRGSAHGKVHSMLGGMIHKQKNVCEISGLILMHVRLMLWDTIRTWRVPQTPTPKTPRVPKITKAWTILYLMAPETLFMKTRPQSFWENAEGIQLRCTMQGMKPSRRP